MDMAKAEKSIKKAWVAGLVWSVIILIGLIQNPGLNPNLFSLILVLGLTYGIFKKSRFAAVVMLLYFMFTLGLALIAYFVKYGLSTNPLILFGTILFLGGFVYYFIQGIVGTFTYFSLTYESGQAAANEPNTDDK